MAYPAGPPWIFDILVEHHKHKDPKMRAHHWDRIDFVGGKRGYLCSKCRAALTDDMIAKTYLFEVVTDTALDLLHWFYMLDGVDVYSRNPDEEIDQELCQTYGG